MSDAYRLNVRAKEDTDAASMVALVGGKPPTSIACNGCGVTWQLDKHGNPYLGPVPMPCERCGSQWFTMLFPVKPHLTPWSPR